MGDGGFTFDMSGITPMLNAMMQRYGQYMDLGLRQAEEEMPRQAEAFNLYSRTRESELKDAKMRRKQAKQAEWDERRSREEARRKEGEAAAEKQRDRMRLNLAQAPGEPFDYGGTRRRGPSKLMSMDPVQRQMLLAQATGTLG